MGALDTGVCVRNLLMPHMYMEMHYMGDCRKPLEVPGRERLEVHSVVAAPKASSSYNLRSAFHGMGFSLYGMRGALCRGKQ